jgi:hypothetical protein
VITNDHPILIKNGISVMVCTTPFSSFS